jgi:hypothetical protein
MSKCRNCESDSPVTNLGNKKISLMIDNPETPTLNSILCNFTVCGDCGFIDLFASKIVDNKIVVGKVETRDN